MVKKYVKIDEFTFGEEVPAQVIPCQQLKEVKERIANGQAKIVALQSEIAWLQEQVSEAEKLGIKEKTEEA